MPHPQNGPEEFVIVYDSKEYVLVLPPASSRDLLAYIWPLVICEFESPGPERVQSNSTWTSLPRVSLQVQLSSAC